MNFSFFTMEFWLSRSLSHELFFFHDVILAIKEPFTQTFFYDGILAINEPFTRTFLFFSMEFWLSRSLSHELFFFLRWNSQNTRFGGRLFSYISQRVLIRLVKNLAS
jgi:hypothetical protein